MTTPTVDLIQFAGLGTNLVLDASHIPMIDLVKIAGLINENGGHLRLVNCKNVDTGDLIDIVNVAPEYITLDFTEGHYR
ncbi:MAG: hypothetical protein ABFR62_12545 [Bacteroidota bacterium]